MRPQHVAYVVKRYPRFSETFVVNEILAHESAGWHLSIFSLLPPNDTHFQNGISLVKAPVTYLPFETPKSSDLWNCIADTALLIPDIWPKLQLADKEDPRCIFQALHLARQIRTRHITHIHAHFASGATSVARLASLFCNVPYTFTAHAKDIFHQSVNPDDLRRKVRDARFTITVSDFNRRYLVEAGCEAKNICRIYNGIDLTQYSYESPDVRPPVILAVGRLVEKKGFQFLIDACAALKAQRAKFECRIVGAGELESQLRAQIERLALDQRVRLLGPLPQPEVRKQMRAACVLVAPCVQAGDGNRDGLPTVLLEAMALGTPCVSTDVTGITEAVQHKKTGWIVPQKDATELASALHQLLAAAPLRVSLAANARRKIEQRFDVVKNTAALRSLFTSASECAGVSQSLSAPWPAKEVCGETRI